jgi:SAM-dependent methyltransferase
MSSGALANGSETSIKSLSGSLRLLASFRFEHREPDRFYRLLADNTVSLISQFFPLCGARLVDVGGGPGDMAEAFRNAGAQAVTIDINWEELHCRPRELKGAVVADGQQLPLSDGSMDLGCISNVLEHVSEPMRLVEDLVRVVRPDGIVFINFTTWLSPFGGHETAPWHLLGGERAALRYEVKHGKPPKNRFGETLFRIRVRDFLRDVEGLNGIEIVDAFPRYLPRWTRRLVRMPGLREVATLNLAVVLRKR